MANFLARWESRYASIGIEEHHRGLRSMGLTTVLLTGDSRSVADHVGKELGVDEIASELLPTRKT